MATAQRACSAPSKRSRRSCGPCDRTDNRRPGGPPSTATPLKTPVTRATVLALARASHRPPTPEDPDCGAGADRQKDDSSSASVLPGFERVNLPLEVLQDVADVASVIAGAHQGRRRSPRGRASA